jgi:hypothetical protein
MSSGRAEERNETLRRVIERAQFIDRVSERPDRASLRLDERMRYHFIVRRTTVVGLLATAATCTVLLSIYWLAAPISAASALLLALLGFTVVTIIVLAYWYLPQSTSGLAGPGQSREASGHVWHADYRFGLKLDRDLLKRRKYSHDWAVYSLGASMLGYPLCIVLRDFRTMAEISGSKRVSGGWLEYGTFFTQSTWIKMTQPTHSSLGYCYRYVLRCPSPAPFRPILMRAVELAYLSLSFRTKAG